MKKRIKMSIITLVICIIGGIMYLVLNHKRKKNAGRRKQKSEEQG